MENNLLCFKNTPKITALSIPREYRDGYTNKEDVWIKLITLSGELKLIFLNKHLEVEQEIKCNSTNNTYLVNPSSTFRITPKSNDLEFILEYYCEAQDYFSNKYNLSPAHEEVVSAVKHIPPCKALDLGAGQGRNTLYLSSIGFDVSAVDNNAIFLQELSNISLEENLNLNVYKHDINQANIKSDFDFIFATDVFMYLNPTRISSIIRNMQNHTTIGGYNLIVSSLLVPGQALAAPFPFSFIQNELREYYDDWKIIQYSEHTKPTKYFSYPHVVLLAKKMSD